MEDIKKSNTRPIRIDEDVYKDVKEYCDKNALKISKWVSKVIMDKLIETKDKMV